MDGKIVLRLSACRVQLYISWPYGLYSLYKTPNPVQYS